MNGAGWYFSMDQASDIAVACALDPKPAYVEALVGAMNYEGGCNPVNVTYLTGLGSRRQREIVDQYAQNDRRVLPPSGIPIGNIQAAFEFLPSYGFALRDASYPGDNAASGPYPFYDRWSDAYNVTTEFISVNQARALLVASFLAGRSPAAARPWNHASARIVAPQGTGVLRAAATLRLDVQGEDLSLARVVWEAPRARGRPSGPPTAWTRKAAAPSGSRPRPSGPTAAARSRRPRSRRTFPWSHGSMARSRRAPSRPAPAATRGTGPNPARHRAPTPPSTGRRPRPASTSSCSRGPRRRSPCARATSSSHGCLSTATHPPSEIMLAWNDGKSWEHRAYWGANIITYGRSGSPGRHHAGGLPSPGRWLELSVPARDVGLEGSQVSGMSFSLVGGSASWDDAGRSR